MSYRVRVFVAVFLATCWTFTCLAESIQPGESRELRMSLNDTFVVKGSDAWKTDVDRVLMLRFAEVYLLPKEGTEISVALRFLCDTPDLARFDTAGKMRAAVEAAAKMKTARAVEKSPEIRRLDVAGRYGFSVTLTDAAIAITPSPEPGQFRYVTQGMVRLSADSALSFVIYTNDLNSKAYTNAMSYIQGFVKPVIGATTQP
jgi:hypothetical protein